MLAARARAPHGNVDALAEVPAREAATGVFNRWVERRGMHGAIVIAAGRSGQ
jgi:hypothetical protein